MDIRLPIMDANGAVALAFQLETAASKAGTQSKLPPTIAAALKQVTTDRDAVQNVLGTLNALEQSPVVKPLDLVLDNGWGTLRDWLDAFGRLPAGSPQGDSARKIAQAVFGSEGLLFTQFKVLEESAASDTRLRVIAESKLDKPIASLGGASILAHVREAHQAYADAIAAASSAADTPKLREALDNLVEAMNLYLVKVVATIERDQPETIARAQALLEPVEDWKARHRASRPQPAAPSPAPAVGTPTNA